MGNSVAEMYGNENLVTARALTGFEIKNERDFRSVVWREIKRRTSEGRS